MPMIAIPEISPAIASVNTRRHRAGKDKYLPGNFRKFPEISQAYLSGNFRKFPGKIGNRKSNLSGNFPERLKIETIYFRKFPEIFTFGRQNIEYWSEFRLKKLLLSTFGVYQMYFIYFFLKSIIGFETFRINLFNNLSTILNEPIPSIIARKYCGVKTVKNICAPLDSPTDKRGGLIVFSAIACHKHSKTYRYSSLDIQQTGLTKLTKSTRMNRCECDRDGA